VLTLGISCIAVDWSGARLGAEKRIWLAKARDGQLLRLENGRSATELTLEVIESAAREPSLVIGLDFAFSFPDWFLAERSLLTAHDLWRLAELEGEEWLAACDPPFWGRPGRRRPPGDIRLGYRRAEYEMRPQPKSVFQVGGPGTVGTGSIRGMPMLRRLRDAGFSIWPYDSPSLPLVLEIYPRLMTGPVVKSNPLKRLELLLSRYPNLDARWAVIAERSEDAFDAAVSALVMSEHADELAALPHLDDPASRCEGRIWHPTWTGDVGGLNPQIDAD
jgi:hypothetical protein